MQKVVHIKRDDFDVYIGRGRGADNVWGNSFRIGEDGSREQVIEKYKEWIVHGEGRHLLRRLGELEGKVLGCWCSPPGGLTASDSLICHGQVFLKLIAHRGKKIEEKKRQQGA